MVAINRVLLAGRNPFELGLTENRANPGDGLLCLRVVARGVVGQGRGDDVLDVREVHVVGVEQVVGPEHHAGT